MFDLAGLASNAAFTQEEAADLLDLYFGRMREPGIERAFMAMQCASLLREAMWSMVSELHLEAPGADYVSYSHENLERLERALDLFRSRHGKLPHENA